MSGSRPVFSVLILKSAPVNFVDTIKQEFSDMFARKFLNKLPRHRFEHQIKVDCQPFTCCPHRLSREKLEAVKWEFEQMEACWICRQSNGPWERPCTL